jgi:hypothetical protein
MEINDTGEMLSNTHRARHITALLGPILREEQYQGRTHLVAPVVALVEGVIQAMNSETPEFVPYRTLSDVKTVLGFNGRPIFLGHPIEDGQPVPGNTPELLEKSAFGTIFNAKAKAKGKKLTLEAWIDVEKANEIDKSIIKRLRRLNADPTNEENEIQISVGVFTDVNENTGVYQGEEYQGEWMNTVPDHLAILQDGHTGACSCEMGCGIRAARQIPTEGVEMGNMYMAWLEAGPETDELLKTLPTIPQEELDKLLDSDFAGANRSFPITKPADVSVIAKVLERAKGGVEEQAKIKAKTISIAQHRGSLFADQLPKEWTKKIDRKRVARQAGFFESLKSSIQSAFRGTSLSSTHSDRDLREALMDELRDMEPNAWDIVAVYEDRVIYSAFESGGACLYQRAYSGDESSGYSLDGNRVEVEPITTFEPVDLESSKIHEARDAASKNDMIQQMHDHSVILGANCAAEVKAAEKSKPCSCGGQAPTTASSTATAEGEIDMTKTERIAALLANKHNLVKDQKALEAASDETLAALEGHCEAMKTAEEKTAADAKLAADTKAAEEAAAAEKKSKDEEAARVAAAATTTTKEDEPLSEKEFLAAAPKRLRDMIARQEATETARHAELVTAMKAAQSEFTEVELQAMELPSLERMAKLVKVPVATVDFSGRGLPRASEDTTVAPPPPSLNDRIRAAQTAKTSH